MTICHGVIQDNRVVLEGNVRLADGLPVEIRLREPEARKTINTVNEHGPESSIEYPTITEDDFKMRLRAEGRLAPSMPRSVAPPSTGALSTLRGSPSPNRSSPSGASGRLLS